MMWTALAIRMFVVIKRTVSVTLKPVKLGRCVRPPRSPSARSGRRPVSLRYSGRQHRFRGLYPAGSDDERSQGGWDVPNHAPTVASSVLNQDIAGRQRHLRPIVELECHVAGEKDPEIRRVGPVKAVVSSTGFVAILEVHLGSWFWCNEVSRQVRPDDEADAT